MLMLFRTTSIFCKYKHNCHSYIQYCHLVTAIKYHLKYTNKGSDEAIITKEGKTVNKDASDPENNDEAQYQQMKSKSFRTSDI